MDRVIVRLTDDVEVYIWRLRDALGNWLGEAEYGTLDRLAGFVAERTSDIWLLLPGERVVSKVMSFSAKERRHLARIAPFQFEESVATDIETLHFSLGEPSGEEVVVAYTNKAWLTQQLLAFEEKGMEVRVCAAEPLMLPGNAGDWCLRFDKLVSVRYGEGLGFAIEPGLVTPALDALLIDAEPPEKITLLADDEDGLDDLKALLPAELTAELELRLESAWEGFGSQSAASVNLRQGEFARRLPIEKWWQDWKIAAIVALVAVISYAGVNIANYELLKREDLALRQQIEKSYRSVISAGRISDAEKQLQSKVKGFKGSAHSVSVMQMISRVGPLIAATEDVSLQGLNYADQRGELRINLRAKTFNSIEQLRGQVEKAGFTAELLNSVAQGDGHQARMRITQIL